MKKTEKFYFYESEFPLLGKNKNMFKKGWGSPTWRNAKHLIKVLKMRGFHVTYKVMKNRVAPYVRVIGQKLPAQEGIQLQLFAAEYRMAS